MKAGILGTLVQVQDAVQGPLKALFGVSGSWSRPGRLLAPAILGHINIRILPSMISCIPLVLGLGPGQEILMFMRSFGPLYTSPLQMRSKEVNSG